MVLPLIEYFLVGVAYDALITLYYISISKGKAHVSAWLSTIITLSQCLVLYNVLLSPEFLDFVIAYSLGCGVGTFITMRFGARKIKHKMIGK